MAWFGFSDSAPPENMIPGEEEYEDSSDQSANEFLLSLLPWGISFLLHAGMVLLAVFVVWTVQKNVDEEEVIIPIAQLSATPGAPLTITKTKKLTKSSSKSSSRRTLATRAMSQSRSALASKVSTKSLSIGMAMQSGKSSPFETGIRAGAGLKAKFFGTGGNARRLAYLVDASGSLIDTLPFVIMELKRSITALSVKQSFTVIFFQGDEAIEIPARGLKRANAENKRRVMSWLDGGNIVPIGLSNPVKALQLALRYKPQLLFILSDNITGEGRYEVDQRRLLRELMKANRGHSKINTIQFLYPDKLEPYGLQPTLKLISQATGGIYKFLDGRELGIE